MDKIRTKTVKGEVRLHMDIQHYVDDFLEMLGEGESLKNALATVLLDQAASTAVEGSILHCYDEYAIDKIKISINVEEESATYEGELIHIEGYQKIGKNLRYE